MATRTTQALAPRAAAWTVVSIWGLVTSVFLWRLLFGLWRLRRLARPSLRVDRGPLLSAVQAVAAEMRVRVPRLYLGDSSAMPAVFGVVRGHLLLPSSAQRWNPQRLRNVLLHELAHLKRRDPLTLLMGGVARAVHWFNPLVWLALYRLRVEQEQACDDEVLRRGVRASDYAQDVLALATRLQATGPAAAPVLSMAEPCRIERRLQIILDTARNRRSLPRSLLVAAALLATSAIVALAGLRAAEEPQESSARTATPTESGATEKAVADERRDEQEELPQIKFEYTRRFLNSVQYHRQADGSYREAVLAKLREVIASKLKEKADWQDAAAARRWLQQTEQAKNWSERELIRVVEEAAAWSLPVVGWAEIRETLAAMNIVKPGLEAPENLLETVAFGAPAANGLRAGWRLEPTQDTYAIGDIVDYHMYFHNGGDAPVQFVTHLWRQEDTWLIRDAAGNESQPQGTWFSGITPHARYLLQPGQYVRVDAPGFAIGEGDYEEQFSTARIGIVIPAKADGDRLHITRGLVLPGFSARDGEGNSQVPTADDWTGSLQTGEIVFRVVPFDPTVIRVGTATFPGRYRVNDDVRLQVSRTTHYNGSYANSAELRWLDNGDAKKPPLHVRPIALPDGLSTFAIGWQRGSDRLWIREATRWREIRFADPQNVQEQHADQAADLDVIDAVRESLLQQKIDVPLQNRPEEKPGAAPNRSPDRDPGRPEDGGATGGPGAETEPLVVLGIEFPRTTAREPKDLPDLYEPSAEPGGWNSRDDIFFMPVDTGLWLEYATSAGRFYIVHRTNADDPASERTYGHYDGDLFERIPALETRLLEQLSESGYSDAGYRLRLMLGSRNPGLIRRALTLAKTTLLGDVALSAKSSLIQRVTPLVRELPATALDEELQILARDVLRQSARVEAEIELSAYTIPDEQYVTADQARVKGEIPDNAWGEAVKGLAMAAVPSATAIGVGESVEFRIGLKNTSDKPIKFMSWDTGEWTELEITDQNNKAVPMASLTLLSGIKPYPHRYVLQPGEQIELGKVMLTFEPQQRAHVFQPVALAGAGEYRVRCRSFGIGMQWKRDEDGRERRFVPAQGEWSGELASALMSLRVE
jgi:beta-lactamase regulating signal transducer with metallopeptidase domain